MKLVFIILGFLALKGFSQDTAKTDSLMTEALKAEDSGNFRAAIDINKEIISLNPKNAEPVISIAGLYGKLKNFDQEIAWARNAIKIDSNSSAAYVNLGNGYAGKGDLLRAKKSYEHADKLDPESPFPPYSLGVIEEAKENFKAARTYYEEAVARDPTFENGFFNLAAMCATMKDFHSAKRYILKVLELNPNATDAKEMLRHINKDLGE
jgi:tetratricopeptide (TPR) repeat protein